ncbi:conserved Plasmodium protein, unknown function [Plasmodium sp. gorilla clade G2]|uniref:conserved Plasmodium protein, unknown function n=1 Tax=Plasmodium sp. gorilla clade G2 TaxID=880535 RepID=UPI000D202CCB|nr:conserved Plasmodium protein, unknown function [Plasmodium sp. gorilla clade G2]SOV11902.1 conserved Plasmodium protein, unknown function [Plasmodium sp. gorilla clade G2]
MIRLIFLFMVDFFIGVIIINVFFEYVKCESKLVSINNELPRIKNINNTFKSIKLFDGSKKKKKSNYLFLSKHNFRKKNDIVIPSSTKKKNFLLKYQKRNHFLYRIICNHNFLILNNTSFLKPTKLTIFNHEAPKNNITPNDSEKEKKKNKALPTDKVNNKKEENVLPIEKDNDKNVENILPIDKKNDKNVENILPIDKQNDHNDNVTLPVNNLNKDQTNNLSLINNEENKNKKNVSENNDTWKKYLQDKRKKEILKDMENKRNNNNNKKKKYNNEYIKNINKYTHNNNNNNSTCSSNMCDISQKDELNENDEIIQDERNYFNDHNNDYYDDDNDYYDDDNDDNFIDDDDDYYNDEDNNYNEQYKDLEEQEKQYNNSQNGKFPYFNNINDTNKHFKNHKNYNEQNNNNNNNNNSSSLNDSLNNIFASNKKNDLPLFFSLNNKSFENSNNKYFDKICSISPNELINRFFENTSERVKEAVKNIIFNIIGNIQKYTIETSILITYEKIYNFLLQIILTGYMIKNADYRLSLNESLYDQNNILNKKDYDEQSDKQEDQKKEQIDVNKEKQQKHEYQEEDLFNLKKSFHTLFSDNNINNMSEEQLNKGDILNSKHIIDPDHNNIDNIDNKDNIDNLQRNGESNNNYPIINTKNYILFLRKKINSLEKQLNMLKESKTFLNDDLLSYIKSLTEIQLRSLTDNIGPLVLDSTKKIVELVIQGMTLNINKNMSNELIYVSGSVLTYICFWQLIIGYTLREMEIRDELSDYLKGN